MKNLMFLLLWIGSGVALMLAYFKFLDRQWTPAVLLAVISVSVILMNVWILNFLKRYEIPTKNGLSLTHTGQIKMHLSGKAIDETLVWAVSFMISAVALVQYPDLLWKWWLSYPVAVLLTALIPVIFIFVIVQKFERVIADSIGIEVRTETKVASKSENIVAWRNVGAVKMIDVYHKAHPANNSQIDSERFFQRELVLYGQTGEQLLVLVDPLAPPAAYKLFLDSIPFWTKLTIQKERVVK